jgi:MYXO-CTERM domain-containing protein
MSRLFGAALALSLLSLASLADTRVAQAQGIGCMSWGRCVEGAPFAMDLACSTGRDCPDPGVCVFEAPGDATGRCLVSLSSCNVCLLPETTECPEAAIGSRGRFQPAITAEGQCEYPICGPSAYTVDRDAPDFPSLAPCFTGAAPRWWNDGDCDEDGLVNELDRGEATCIANRPVSRISEGGVTCARGRFAQSPTAGPFCGSVSIDPAVIACTEDAPLAFGICCERVEDCPLVPGVGVRCVRLPGDEGVEGVCTYGRDVPPTDTSCLAPSARGATCDSIDSPTPYERWADGNCDLDCEIMPTRNADSELVCGCAPDAGTDAGLDAAVVRDAGVDASTLDATLSPDTAVDAAPTGPSPRFGGSGLSCGVTPRGASAPPVLTLVLLALALLRRRPR